MLTRIFVNTAKQIKRSGWVAWSSIAVMTLAFFIATIFGGLAYLSNLYIQFIETRDNVIVFFEVGTDQEVIDKLKEKWSERSEVKNIDYTTEEEAYSLYLAETAATKPVEHELLLEYEEKRLPSSLDIQLYSLDKLESFRPVMMQDINTELSDMDYDPNDPPIVPRIDDETLNELREVFGALRVGGAVVLVLLFVIIFFFTLMTVEFRTYNRMEEIGVMQLVGGSLAYIRAPYILEGAFYGFLGALISTGILGAIYAAVFVLNPGSSLATFIYERVSILALPDLEWWGWAVVIGAKLLIGIILGALTSYVAIRRYIK